jgi:hypothetical protein
LLARLKAAGRAAADRFLSDCLPLIGETASLDLPALLR